MSDSENLPFWFPVRADAEYCQRIREDYEDAADDDDETIREEYAHGDFEMLWDNLGDAREAYEPLAEAYLNLLDSHAALVDALQAAPQKPVAWQFRIKHLDGSWGAWKQCDEKSAQQVIPDQEVRALYAAPPT